ncbi:TetR/AcrR family transcriptional regulator [Variovorax sp. RTB1]|uniref:TetR/AcrR family transcriptional regulator n=1 Tax=Variovorax sp. RTB1 TaxID=3048631 RepID=UPI002B22B7A4|nr:TetR/AcrR family transcriptional regulator [Variovorax sp. RTB1]MEB0113692.1 TetR/AcrR family transcriptional regulator [Variovorax sp. RTB1]
MIECFWSRGYEANSVRDPADAMGIAGPSLYNTFGDKRTLYRQALERYVERGFCDRIRRFESQLAP